MPGNHAGAMSDEADSVTVTTDTPAYPKARKLCVPFNVISYLCYD